MASVCIGRWPSMSISPVVAQCNTRPWRASRVRAPARSPRSTKRCITVGMRSKRSDEKPVSSGRMVSMVFLPPKIRSRATSCKLKASHGCGQTARWCAATRGLQCAGRAPLYHYDNGVSKPPFTGYQSMRASNSSSLASAWCRGAVTLAPGPGPAVARPATASTGAPSFLCRPSHSPRACMALRYPMSAIC